LSSSCCCRPPRDRNEDIPATATAKTPASCRHQILAHISCRSDAAAAGGAAPSSSSCMDGLMCTTACLPASGMLQAANYTLPTAIDSIISTAFYHSRLFFVRFDLLFRFFRASSFALRFIAFDEFLFYIRLVKRCSRSLQKSSTARAWPVTSTVLLNRAGVRGPGPQASTNRGPPTKPFIFFSFVICVLHF